MSPWYLLEFFATLVIVLFLTVTAWQMIEPPKACLCVKVASSSQTVTQTIP